VRFPSLVLPLLLAASGVSAQTLPLQTEEATTAPARTIVLETAVEGRRAEPDFQTGAPRDTWAGPLLRLVWSPADPVEMDLEWVARVGERNDPAFGSASDFGDVSLRAKVRFRDEDRGVPALGARFTVTLPETSFGQGLGPNALRMAAQALLTRTFGRTRLHLNAGLGLHDEVYRPHEQRDFFVYGMALEQRVSAGVALVGEVAGRKGKGMPGADERSEIRVGARLGSGRVTAAAAVRRGLAAADGTWGATAGVRWRLRD
jgi:hypothetical protein